MMDPNYHFFPEPSDSGQGQYLRNPRATYYGSGSDGGPYGDPYPPNAHSGYDEITHPTSMYSPYPPQTSYPSGFTSPANFSHETPQAPWPPASSPSGFAPPEYFSRQTPQAPWPPASSPSGFAPPEYFSRETLQTALPYPPPSAYVPDYPTPRNTFVEQQSFYPEAGRFQPSTDSDTPQWVGLRDTPTPSSSRNFLEETYEASSSKKKKKKGFWSHVFGDGTSRHDDYEASSHSSRNTPQISDFVRTLIEVYDGGRSDFVHWHGSHLVATPETHRCYSRLRPILLQAGASDLVNTLENEGQEDDLLFLTTQVPGESFMTHGLIREQTRGKGLPAAVQFTPNLGGVLSNGSLHSSGSLLAHELQHAYDLRLISLGRLEATALANVPHDQYGTVPEARAIATENLIAKVLSEGERTEYFQGMTFFSTQGFMSTEPAYSPVAQHIDEFNSGTISRGTLMQLINTVDPEARAAQQGVVDVTVEAYSQYPPQMPTSFY